MAKEIPGLPPRWGQFILCVLYHMGAPLAPLLLEWGLTQTVTAHSATLTVCLYALTLANSSRDAAIFGIGLAIAIIMAVIFGIVTGGMRTLPWMPWLTMACGGIIAVTHAIERYNRHIVGVEPFWSFLSSKEKGG